MVDVSRVVLAVDSRQVKTASRDLDGMHRSGRLATDSSKTLTTATKALGGALAAIGVQRVASELTRYADASRQANNQIRQVVDSERELMEVRRMLSGVAADTNSALDTTVGLYTEMFRATRDLGKSQEDIAGVTRTINNLFLAGGKAASETAGAVRQLAQGLAAGALRGDEFNSVAEGAPRILDALSESLGKGRGELREFAATGGITSEILVKALEEYSETAQMMADQTELTFGVKMVNAQRNVTEFVGEMDTLNSTIDVAGDAIVGLTNNLDVAFDIVGALAALTAGRAVGAAMAYVAAVRAQAAADAAATASIVAKSAAMNAGIATTGAATAATATATGGARLLAGALGLIGGPAGAAALAAYGIWTFRDSLVDTNTVAGKFVEKLQEIDKQFSVISPTRLGEGIAELIDKGRELGLWEDDLDRLGKELVKTIKPTDAMRRSTEGAADAIREAEGATEDWLADLGKLWESLQEANDRELEQTIDRLEGIMENIFPLQSETVRLQEEWDFLNRTLEGLPKDQVNATLAAWADTYLPEVQVSARRVSAEIPQIGKATQEASVIADRGLERMRDGFGDFFQDLIVDGKASFDGLLDLFKRMIAEMIATAAANRVMVSLGMMTSGQAMASGGMLGQGGFSLSGIGNMLMTGGAAAKTALSTAGAWLSTGGGVGALAPVGVNYAAHAAAAPGLTAAAGGGLMSTIGTALPWIGGGLLAANMLGLFDRKPSDKRQYASGGFGGTDQILTGFGGDKFSAENQGQAGALLAQIQMMGQAIGGTTAAGSVSVGGRTGLRLATGEGEGSFRTFANEADLLTAAWEEVLAGATNLVPVVKQLAMGFEGGAEAGIEYTRTLQALWEATGQNGATAAAKAMHQAQRTLADVYKTSTNDVRVLAFEFDGSAQATAALSQALAENQGVAYQLAMQYRQVRDSVSGLFGSLSESIRTSLMSQDELYNYQRRQVDTLSSALATMTDPGQIMETSQRIEQLVSGMWGRLSEEQRQEMGAGFLDTITDVERLATRQLNTQLKMLESSQERTGAIIRQSIQAAAQELSASAAQQTQAAQINLQAAQLNLQAAQARMRGAEVNA